MISKTWEYFSLSSENEIFTIVLEQHNNYVILKVRNAYGSLFQDPIYGALSKYKIPRRAMLYIGNRYTKEVTNFVHECIATFEKLLIFS